MKHRNILFIILGILIGLTVWITNLDMLKFRPPATYGELFIRISEHLKMVGLAELIAISIGIPFGIFVSRPKFSKISHLVMSIVNVGQTIPTMGLVAIVAVILGGFGFTPAVVALFIYGLLPIVRNSYAGIKNIDPAIIEAAKGMGMSKRQIIWKIELPLARRVIMAGIRTSTVVNVGAATLAALIAAGGLGMIILAGLYNNIPLLLLQGAAPTAALAMVLDAVIGGIEEWVTPRGLRIKRGA